MNPYQSLGGAPVTTTADPNYGIASPYGAGQSWAAGQLANVGWHPGMPPPQLPQSQVGPNNPNTPLYYDPSSSGNAGTAEYDQQFLNALYKVYTDSHNPEADARLAAYTKSTGANAPGGVIPPTPNANQDPWGTLNSMGMGKPGFNSAGQWDTGAPYSPWQPMMGSMNEGVTHFGQWYGTGGFAQGNGPGGWNPANTTANWDQNKNYFSSSPWGTWDANAVGMTKPTGPIWTPSTGQGTDPWYG